MNPYSTTVSGEGCARYVVTVSSRLMISDKMAVTDQYAMNDFFES